MSSQVRMMILPSVRCLFDEPTRVMVSGLRPGQLVTMAASSTDRKGVTFRSSATYRASGDGQVDPGQQPSLGGSYQGLEPAGLLWSMKPDAPHARLHLTDARTPHLVHFSVHEQQEEGGGPGPVLAQVTNERRLLADGVSRLPVNEGNVHGVLFSPPGAGPYPAVLDLYEFSAGLSEKRAALLANKGFVVLTMCLFGAPHQADPVSRIQLDYFEEAIQFLRKQPRVSGGGVGLISLSKSGDLVLSIATYLQGVAVTVWISGCSANTMYPLYDGRKLLLPPLLFDKCKASLASSGAYNIRYCLHDHRGPPQAASVVPVERATGHFLLAAAQDDLNWDSASFSAEVEARLRSRSSGSVESVLYPGAGHYLEPPYGPFCPSSFHGVVGGPALWGGQPADHARAEVHLWGKIQEFFRKHLGGEDLGPEPAVAGPGEGGPRDQSRL